MKRISNAILLRRGITLDCLNLLFDTKPAAVLIYSRFDNN
ncbi:hypothetical protein T12_8244 [Trichinella patagoniensis]|uniref:Uncharacterized protein n=1 Tax=Trichinella patagoniensis TaxID=990121 RepID=A0A0V0YSG3_9BILA|nr:hypothetical protein T12_8244 [Trichinella patagoniensis]